MKRIFVFIATASIIFTFAGCQSLQRDIKDIGSNIQD